MAKLGNYSPIQGKSRQSHRDIKETGVWDNCTCYLLGNRGECLGERVVSRTNEVKEENH